MSLTFTPRIEENVCVCFWVSWSTQDAIGSPDCDVHAEFPHNAFGRRLNGKPHRPVVIHDNLGPPLSASQLLHHRHWDVGALVLLRVATYEAKEGTGMKSFLTPLVPSLILWQEKEDAIRLVVFEWL